MDHNKKVKLKIPLLDFSDSTKRTRWFLRVISLAFAIVLWLFVTWDGSTLSKRELSIPLKFTDLPDGYSISNRTRDIVVTIEGRVDAIALLNRNAITASVSIQKLAPGKYSLPVQLDVPDSVRLVSYTPQAVDFELFRIIERTLRPALSIRGDMPDNLSLETVSIVPPEVVVKGSERDVLGILRAEVRATVAELRTDADKELPVVLAGSSGEVRGLIIEPRRVRVSADFTEALETISVPIEITTRGVPEDGLDISSVHISPDMVTLRGSRSALSGITKLSLSAIDVTGLTEDMVVDIPLDSPGPDIVIVGPEYAKVKVELSAAAEVRTYMNVPVAIRGRGVYSNWKIAPSAVSVTIERSVASSVSFDLAAPPLELYVDVTNVVSPELLLPVLTSDVAGGIKVIRMEPEQVVVTAVMP